VDKDKISVLMCTYNSEGTVTKSINSILNQTYKNYELLIMDDCSSDNTYSICSEYKENYKNIKLFRNKENIGLTKSLNKLINKSKGKFIARQDSDDLSVNNRLEIQIDYLLKNKLDACTSRAYVTGTKRLIPGISYYLPIKFLIKLKNPFIHGTLFIKKDVIEKIGMYDENFFYAQDYKLLTDLIKKGYNLNIQNIPLYHLNMKNNISNKFKNEQNYYANCVRKNIVPKS